MHTRESVTFSLARKEKPAVLEIGPPLACDSCVLPEGYAGATFSDVLGDTFCNFCIDFQEPKFLGGEQLKRDLDLSSGEQVGVTVSGGKDSLYTWMWLVDNLGSDRVVAFNHQKVGLVHNLAEANLHRAKEKLGTELIQQADFSILPRFQKNLKAFLKRPDPAMVRVALCAGCRVGISGSLFTIGEELGITKYVSSASYLELAPFKAEIMKVKGGDDEREGLLIGLGENPHYDHGDNIDVIMLEDAHCHKTQLTGGGSFHLYPNIRYFDFDSYFPNIPVEVEAVVKERLGWERPERSWHFDCLTEEFKDVFYYGLLGYNETDYNLSAMIRHGLITREEGIIELNKARGYVVNNREKVFNLMNGLKVGHLIPEVERFYESSPFLSEQQALYSLIA